MGIAWRDPMVEAITSPMKLSPTGERHSPNRPGKKKVQIPQGRRNIQLPLQRIEALPR
jgi:hypothetical protein